MNDNKNRVDVVLRTICDPNKKRENKYHARAHALAGARVLRAPRRPRRGAARVAPWGPEDPSRGAQDGGGLCSAIELVF